MIDGHPNEGGARTVEIRMARCNCQGGTCSCVIAGGEGIEVRGAGSSTSPYIIDATGVLDTALIVHDTQTVDLSLVGNGTPVDPLILSADATLRMRDLTDVRSPANPDVGQVPMWMGDHWEFAPPQQGATGAVTTGGVIGDGTAPNPLRAAVSGIWGQGSMTGFPADSTLGVPIYTDTAGQLRARPIPLVRYAQAPFASWGTDPTGAGRFGNAPGYVHGVDNYWWRWGPIIGYQQHVVRLGVAAPAVADGNWVNLLVGSLRGEMPVPLGYHNAFNVAGAPITQYYLRSDRAILTQATVPNRNWPVNEVRTVSGWYMSNPEVAL